MTDRERLIQAMADVGQYMDCLRAALADEDPEGPAPAPPPVFEEGQAVVVWTTGERGEVFIDDRHSPDILISVAGGAFVLCKPDELLAIPKRPPSTAEYVVGKYARPEMGKHEGWLSVAGDACWFDDVATRLGAFDGEQHGYRWMITRVSKPLFEKGQRVRVCDEGPAKGSAFVVDERRQHELAGWSYFGLDEQGNHYARFERNLELADEAPRPQLPSTPPEYTASDGKLVPMRWVLRNNTQRLSRRADTHEYYYDGGCVRQARIPTLGVHYICEPAPLVKGWDGEWLVAEVNTHTGKLYSLSVTDDEPITEIDRCGNAFVGIHAKDFPVPTDLVIPETSHE